MTYTANTIAAAIMTLADRSITEQNIAITDNDAMGRVMLESEEMMARQLARSGMALQEALELAATASTMHGRETGESTTLADDAYRNRHAPVPTASAPVEADMPAANGGGKADAETRDGDDVTSETTGQALAIGDDAQEMESASVEIAAPAAPARARRAPATGFVPVEKARPTAMRFDVVMKKVHEVFRGVRPEDVEFDFEVPVINWEGIHPGVPEYDAAYSFDPSHLHTVLYAIHEGSTVNLVGPHGCGKTQMVAQIAARLNFPLIELPMDGQIARRDMIGQEKLRVTEFGTESYFSEGDLTKALAEPGFILFDEVDRAVSDLQYACHSVYLMKGLKLLEDGGRKVPMHPYNRVFGTANTKGRGSLDGMYQAAEEMSEATRDRWSLWLDMDYPDAETDAAVLVAKVPKLLAEQAQIIAGVANEIREAYKQGRLSQTCSMRNQLDVAKKAAFLCVRERDDVRRQKALRHAFDRVILGRASPDDKGAIDNLIQIKMPQAYQGTPFL